MADEAIDPPGIARGPIGPRVHRDADCPGGPSSTERAGSRDSVIALHVSDLGSVAGVAPSVLLAKLADSDNTSSSDNDDEGRVYEAKFAELFDAPCTVPKVKAYVSIVRTYSDKAAESSRSTEKRLEERPRDIEDYLRRSSRIPATEIKEALPADVERPREQSPALIPLSVPVPDEALERFIVEIVRAHESRVSPVRNVTSDPNWSFGHSFFFSSTIITTIGYGNITPLSTGGKIFCIVYGLIGIPLTLILLSAFVERLLIPVTCILQFLNSKLGHLYQAFNIRVLHLFIVGLLVVVLFFLVPAAIFSSLEPEWDYVDSLYYCFISLTTIGLGDYTPGDSYDQPYRPLYKVAVVGYLLVGLTFMMLLLNVLYDIPQLNVGIFFLLKSDEMTNDPEKVRLHHGLGPKYTQQIDDPPQPAIRHIKAHPPPPSSSPEDIP
ncbi:hypothetical protein HPB47_004748 [Ixodes persulcatus]|uniref:Uncharacterized protein n=1 Tax=Ixodes persulcatus TaxID=34615 RepID=A0AC60PEU5_IXOPE|nr:hypothetical protein HPB47_004748 [Ixodes persulcatus]